MPKGVKAPETKHILGALREAAVKVVVMVKYPGIYDQRHLTWADGQTR